MKAAAFLVGDERKIAEEIRAWSATVLEVENPFFNNLPPCPYAKKAWQDERVGFKFKYEKGYQELYSCLSQWEDTLDVLLVVDRNYDADPERFHDYLDELNEAIANGFFIDKDFWLMGFHPDDEPNEYLDDESFTHVIDEPYAIIFLQRLSKVQDAADKLAKNGYYETYFDEYDVEELFAKRTELHRRLNHGNEAA